MKQLALAFVLIGGSLILPPPLDIAGEAVGFILLTRWIEKK